MEEFEKKLNKIFGIYYIAPHASPDGVHFDEPRCGDCFCTIQEVHTHASQKELKQRDKVLELIINTIDEIKDIMYKMPAVNIIQIEGQQLDVLTKYQVASLLNCYPHTYIEDKIKRMKKKYDYLPR